MIRSKKASVARAEPPFVEITHDGAVARVAVTRSPSAKRVTLRVRAATRDAVVTAPRRVSMAFVRDFVERHAAWIGARLGRLPAPVPFAPGALTPVRGVPHEIAHRPGARGVAWTQEREGAYPLLCVSGAREHLARRVEDFLKREARRDLEAAVARHAASADVVARRITLRDTTSRWGSCTAQGALNFSWRLIMAPDFVLDYLAAHEVAHLVHLDHSPRFWALTRRLAPHTDRAEAWLKAQGASLHRYGVPAQNDAHGETSETVEAADAPTHEVADVLDVICAQESANLSGAGPPAARAPQAEAGACENSASPPRRLGVLETLAAAMAGAELSAERAARAVERLSGRR
jgi:hypothetical protein